MKNYIMVLVAGLIVNMGCREESVQNRPSFAVAPSVSAPTTTPPVVDAKVVDARIPDASVRIVPGDVSVVSVSRDSGVVDSQNDLSMEEMDRQALEDSKTVRTVPVRNDSGVVIH